MPSLEAPEPGQEGLDSLALSAMHDPGACAWLSRQSWQTLLVLALHSFDLDFDLTFILDARSVVIWKLLVKDVDIEDRN